MLELIIEKFITSEKETSFRAIVINTDEDGYRTVFEIYEHPMVWMFFDVPTWKEYIGKEEVLWTVEISERHKNIDFGRARKFSSKIKKICEQL